jgi:flagellar biosynthesis/type III secretory pathway chaperone
MELPLNQLGDILDLEIAVAEQLTSNLTAQKQAIAEWDMDQLLAQVEARLPLLHSLDELERQRLSCLDQAGCDQPVQLRQLINGLPANSTERRRLAILQQNSKTIFTRLQTDEQYFHTLMENLLAHIHSALNSVLPLESPVYSETGAAESARPASTFFHGKA